MPDTAQGPWLAVLTPAFWAFLRAAALLSTMPLTSSSAVPWPMRLGLAALVALALQATDPLTASAVQSVIQNATQAHFNASLHDALHTAPDAAHFGALVAQQLIIGASLGFAVRLVFAGVEMAGELLGLQMGLNFASLYEPGTLGGDSPTAGLAAVLMGGLFLALNGHLLLIQALADSFVRFPAGPEPFAFLRTVQAQHWGAALFASALWIALPLLALLLFAQALLALMARVAPQLDSVALGFPFLLGLGLVALMLALPGWEQPFTAVLERLFLTLR